MHLRKPGFQTASKNAQWSNPRMSFMPKLHVSQIAQRASSSLGLLSGSESCPLVCDCSTRPRASENLQKSGLLSSPGCCMHQLHTDWR